MSIHFFQEDVVLPNINYEVLLKVLKREVKINKYKLGDINYIFCSDEYLLDINIKFLNHDFYTDVITFDYSDGRILSGDIYISTEMVLNNSLTFGQLYMDELVRVISHGLLHLLQFNDKEQDEIKLMREKEADVVLRFNSLIDLQSK